ncbi:hypothetical protein CBM2633_B40105 [Cupriavidus taiwanensis]|nr:hypothetical protein CBM2633_B40105 [Cupriavidus taiwanensis]
MVSTPHGSALVAVLGPCWRHRRKAVRWDQSQLHPPAPPVARENLGTLSTLDDMDDTAHGQVAGVAPPNPPRDMRQGLGTCRRGRREVYSCMYLVFRLAGRHPIADVARIALSRVI